MAKKNNRYVLELRQLIDDVSSKSDVQLDQNECEKLPEAREKKSNVEVVVFEKRKKKLNTKVSTVETDDKSKIETKKVNFHKTRFEVQNFGINGFAKDDKEKAKVALAIRLGAKPPKNKFLNYKKLMEIKKEEQRLSEAVDDHHSLRAKKRPSKINKNKVRGFDEAFGKVNKPKDRKFSFKKKNRK